MFEKTVSAISVPTTSTKSLTNTSRAANGLKAQKSKAVNPVLGFTDTATVKDDLDNVTFNTALYLAFRALRWFRHDYQGKLDLEGLIILKSSPNYYHLVFNKPVCWRKNLHAIAWIAQRVKNRDLDAYVIMQAIKECSTLRVGSEGDKLPPRIVFRFGKQDKQIKIFLQYQKLTLRLESELKREERFV